MVSQFKIYTSWDIGAPVLTGESGSLLNLLKSCLIDGYGTGSYYKEPAGWIAPLTHSNNKGCYQQPSGSRLILFVHDAAPITGSGGQTRDACVCGCETISDYTGSSINEILPSASGYFPTYYQTYYGVNSTYNPNSTRAPQGTICWKKSQTTDATQRPWIMFADAWTMYLFVNHGGDTGTNWSLYQFGDIFSFYKSVDRYKCVIGGRVSADSDTGGYMDWSDMMVYQGFLSNYALYAAKSWGGYGPPVMVNRMGNLSTTTNHAGYCTADGTPHTMVYPFYGYLNAGNGPNQSLYINPVMCGEPYGVAVRGRFRGMYHLSHQSQNFSIGEIIQGANEYGNKTFMYIGMGIHNGHWLIEISPTVETNELP